MLLECCVVSVGPVHHPVHVSQGEVAAGCSFQSILSQAGAVSQYADSPFRHLAWLHWAMLSSLARSLFLGLMWFPSTNPLIHCFNLRNLPFLLLSIYLSIRLSTYPSIYPSIYLYLSIYLSIYLPIYLFSPCSDWIQVFFCLFIYLYDFYFIVLLGRGTL
jgi:hypothetical protein